MEHLIFSLHASSVTIIFTRKPGVVCLCRSSRHRRRYRRRLAFEVVRFPFVQLFCCSLYTSHILPKIALRRLISFYPNSRRRSQAYSLSSSSASITDIDLDTNIQIRHYPPKTRSGFCTFLPPEFVYTDHRSYIFPVAIVVHRTSSIDLDGRDGINLARHQPAWREAQLLSLLRLRPAESGTKSFHTGRSVSASPFHFAYHLYLTTGPLNTFVELTIFSPF